MPIRQILAALFPVLFLSSCSEAQNTFKPELAGAPCEGCEAVFEYGDRNLTSADTLPAFQEEGTKIKVTGTIYEKDGKTPAENVILYVYHTNREGLYAAGEDARGWGKRHGDNRGWLKTGKNGHYAFYTLKPAPYPNRPEPAHIHYTILEPGGKYYWLESCYFEGDSLLVNYDINTDTPRGGSSGVLTLRKEGELLVGTRDIVLGKNIPGYD